MEEENPERAARFKKHREELDRKMNDTEKTMKRISQRMAKWENSLKN